MHQRHRGTAQQIMSPRQDGGSDRRDRQTSGPAAAAVPESANPAERHTGHWFPGGQVPLLLDRRRSCCLISRPPARSVPGAFRPPPAAGRTWARREPRRPFSTPLPGRSVPHGQGCGVSVIEGGIHEDGLVPALMASPCAVADCPCPILPPGCGGIFSGRAVRGPPGLGDGFLGLLAMRLACCSRHVNLVGPNWKAGQIHAASWASRLT